MPKYINADLIDWKTISIPTIVGAFVETKTLDGFYALKRDIDAMPAADVQEVKYAKDLQSERAFSSWTFECSRCHFFDDDTYYIDSQIGSIKYCPNCGAKIQEVKKNEK
mgnify:CR=1 FL=1